MCMEPIQAASSVGHESSRSQKEHAWESRSSQRKALHKMDPVLKPSLGPNREAGRVLAWHVASLDSSWAPNVEPH